MTINNNFCMVEVKLQVLIHLLYFGPTGLDLMFLFMVTGAYYGSGQLIINTTET